MARSFLRGPPDDDLSLEELQDYLKPLSQEEMQSELASALLEPPPQQESRHEPKTLLDEFDTDPIQFAQQALEQPEMWDQPDLQYLQDVLEGGEVNEQLQYLSDDFYSGRAAQRAAARSPLSPGPLPEMDETDDIEEAGLMDELIPIALPPQVEIGEQMDLTRVEKWWEK